jgi:cytochrome c peroxidase
MKKPPGVVVSLCGVLCATSCTVAADVTGLEAIGKALFFDPSLSEPAGQSCASCHDPQAGFADPDREQPTSEGVRPGLFGARNTPTTAYAAFSPTFGFDADEQLYAGGQFWDGRAATLEEQAGQPLLNPLEMANRDQAMVVEKVRRSPHAEGLRAHFGSDVLEDTERAYESITIALAAYERSTEMNPFSSRYDAFLAGTAELSPLEREGLELFEREDKGNCAACHPTRPADDGTPPLFTDFTYDNLGTPANPHNPFYRMAATHNPDGADYLDPGLGANPRVETASETGKFKVPTLRNIEYTAPYMHNGVFATLDEVVAFYNSRDTDDRWGAPEIADNVNKDELGDLGLTEGEIAAIVAFMRTLSDGFGDAPSDPPREGRAVR